MRATCSIVVSSPKSRKSMIPTNPEVIAYVDGNKIRRKLTPQEEIAFAKMAKAAGDMKSAETAFERLFEDEYERRDTCRQAERQKKVLSKIADELRKELDNEGMLCVTELEASDGTSRLTNVELLENLRINQAEPTGLFIGKVAGATTLVMALVAKEFGAGFWEAIGAGLGCALFSVVFGIIGHAMVSGRNVRKFLNDNKSISAILSVTKSLVDEALKATEKAALPSAKE